MGERLFLVHWLKRGYELEQFDLDVPPPELRRVSPTRTRR